MASSTACDACARKGGNVRNWMSSLSLIKPMRPNDIEQSPAKHNKAHHVE
ncbi:hypothetical protein CRG98_048640, partial [Punica granatum]